MPRATGTLASCEKAYSQYEAEMDSLLDQFISAAESAPEFYRSIEKAEEQVAAARKMISTNADLELNETAIMADRMEGELAIAEKYAHGAALSESQEEWAGEMEAARLGLERLGSSLRKMKAASHENEALEVRGALAAFRRHEKELGLKVKKLKETLGNRKHSAFSRLRGMRKKVQLIRSDVARAFDSLAKRRLRKKTAEARQTLTHFARNAEAGRIIVDAKHVTLFSGRKIDRMPLTQSLRFALEEMAPINKPLARLGRNGTMLVGSFEKSNGRHYLRIGERSVVGDSIVYSEKKYLLG